MPLYTFLLLCVSEALVKNHSLNMPDQGVALDTVINEQSFLFHSLSSFRVRAPMEFKIWPVLRQSS